LADLASLPDDDIETIGAAIGAHYGAALLLERDLSSAYTLLVAGIETLSRRYGRPPEEWDAWEESGDWEEFTRALGLTDSQRQALFGRLMRDRNLRLSETFANYASTRIPDSFWDRPWNEWQFPIYWDANGARYSKGDWLSRRKVRDLVAHDRDMLNKCLRKTYELRSRFVHQGRRVDLMGQAVPYGEAIEGTGPLPFAVLRSVLAELVETELHERASAFTLPNILLCSPRGNSGDPPPGHGPGM
jgi:hypothetical protein